LLPALAVKADVMGFTYCVDSALNATAAEVTDITVSEGAES